MNAAENRVAVRVVVSGRVQGVWYRAWTVQTAVELGLEGWVRNRADGSVEALFVGPADKTAAMAAACRRGPPAALVADVAVEPTEPPPPGGGFVQRESVSERTFDA